MDLISFLQNTGAGRVLITFLISMTPIFELRGAIPVGVSMGLSHWGALMISVIGNMVPVPLIILFIRKIFSWLRVKIPSLERFINKLEQKAESKKGLIEKWKFFGLYILVAIPLPGTGAWTGALVAALLDIRLKRAVPAILLGVLTAGILVTGITFGFTEIF